MPVRRIAAAVAALLAAACAPAVPPSQPGTPVPQDAAAAALVSSLSVETGDTVRLTLQVTNAASTPVTLSFPSGQAYDFAVLRGGETLWAWSADRTFIQALREETLAPGETRTYAETWVPGTAPRGGELTARAWLTSTSHPVVRTAAFRLP